MKDKDSFYDMVAWVSSLLVPVAPSVFFAAAVYKEAAPHVPVAWLAIAGAGATAVGLEAVGLVTGHVGLALLRQRNPLWLLAAVILVVYVFLGASALPEALRVAFYIAPLAYLTTGLLYLMREQREQATMAQQTVVQQEVSEQSWQREQQERAAEREHQRQMRELELKYEARMVRKTAATDRHVTTIDRPNQQNVSVTDRSDWRLLTDQEKLQLTEYSPSQVANLYGVSNRTARRWLADARLLTTQVATDEHANGSSR